MSKKKILLVDDAAFMRTLLKKALHETDYEVIGEAENGLQAIEYYQELKPDLVIMDITMPEMDGIQAVRNIVEKDPSAKILMCSALGQHAMVIEAVEAGAKDFVVKPFKEDRVIEAIKKIIG